MLNTDLKQEMSEKRIVIMEMFENIFPKVVQEDFNSFRLPPELFGDKIWMDFYCDILEYDNKAELWVGCRITIHKDKNEDYYPLCKKIKEEIIKKLPIKPFYDEDAVSGYFRMKPYREFDKDGFATLTFFVNPEIPTGAGENHTL